MAFTFGAPQPAAQPATGSLFGNTAAATNTTAAKPFSFGAPAAQSGSAQPTSSLFGNTASTPAAGTTASLFGSQPQQGQQPAQSGSLFGNTASQPAQSGGLFGNTSTANTSTQPASTSLFGSTTAQPGQQQQQQGTSSGGLFGSTTANAGNAGTTGSLFGQPQQQQQQQQQQQSGGLFGSTNQPSTSLFGSTTQPQAQTGSLFGSTAAQPQQQQQQQQQPQQQQLNASTSKPQSNLFASTSAAPGLFATKPEQDVGTRILAVKNAWDTNSQDCKFKYYFYNVVEPGTASRYGRPANAVDEEKWNKALRENPDPENMVPVLATGWADVKKRMQMQEAIASVHQERVKEITKALQELTTTTTLSSSQRLSNLQHRLSTLQHRLIKLAGQTPAYNPHFQSTAIRPEETATKAILENVKAELDGRGKGAVKSNNALGVSTGTPRRHPSEGRLAGQVNELWGQVEEIRRRRKGLQNGVNDQGWLSDEKVLQEVAEILSKQQYALQKLKALADDSLFDADVIRQGLNAIER